MYPGMFEATTAPFFCEEFFDNIVSSTILYSYTGNSKLRKSVDCLLICVTSWWRYKFVQEETRIDRVAVTDTAVDKVRCDMVCAIVELLYKISSGTFSDLKCCGVAARAEAECVRHGERSYYSIDFQELCWGQTLFSTLLFISFLFHLREDRNAGPTSPPLSALKNCYSSDLSRPDSLTQCVAARWLAIEALKTAWLTKLQDRRRQRTCWETLLLLQTQKETEEMKPSSIHALKESDAVHRTQNRMASRNM